MSAHIDTLAADSPLPGIDETQRDHAVTVEMRSLKPVALLAGPPVGGQLSPTARTLWATGYGAGFGVHAPSGEIASNAVTDFELSDAITKSQTDTYAWIETESDLDSVMNLGAKGNFNAYGGSCEFETHLQKQFSVSRKSLSLVAMRTITWSDSQVKVSDLPSLGRAARRMLIEKGQQEFKKNYGDYFVAGYTKQARFFAIYQLQSKTTDQMTNFKASAAYRNPAVLDASGSTEFNNDVKSNSLEIRVTVVVDGVAKGLGTFATTSSEILKLANDFETDAIGNKVEAILFHYGLIVHDLDTLDYKIDVAPIVLERMRKLYRKKVYCEAICRAIKTRRKVSFNEKLKTIADRIEAEIPLSLNGVRPEVVDGFIGMYDTWQKEYTVKCLDWQNFRDELDRQQDAKSGDNNHANVWRAGFATSQYPDVQRNMSTTTHEVHKNHGALWDYCVASVEPSDTSKIICGYEVHANWHDGTDGTWQLKKSGLRNCAMHVRIEGKTGRGCSWTLNIHWVPRDLLYPD